MNDELWQVPGDAPRDRWLLSYADLVTLLLAFFVVMYSVSAVNEVKLSELASTLSESFDPATTKPVDDSENSQVLLTNLQELLGQELALSLTESGKVVSLKVEVPGELLFASGAAELSEAGARYLNDLLPTLNLVEGAIRIEGHTDNQPINTEEFPSNWELSAHRAARIASFLEEKSVSAKISATGLSASKPVASNATEEGRRKNRRVVIYLEEVDSALLSEWLRSEISGREQLKAVSAETADANQSSDLAIEDIDPALLEQLLQELEGEAN